MTQISAELRFQKYEEINLWELQLPWCELMSFTYTIQAKSCL